MGHSTQGRFEFDTIFFKYFKKQPLSDSFTFRKAKDSTRIAVPPLTRDGCEGANIQILDPLPVARVQRAAPAAPASLVRVTPPRPPSAHQMLQGSKRAQGPSHCPNQSKNLKRVALSSGEAAFET
jgi:hypothetical protein